MTDRQKSWLFLLLGTVVNLIITIIYFIAFLVATLYFLHNYLETYGSALLYLPLLCSVVASFFSYRALIKWADRKWHIQQHLRPKK